MRNISIFQLVVLGIFFIFLSAGVIVVSIYSSKGGKAQLQPTKVVIWGALDGGAVQEAINTVARGNSNLRISYVQKSEGSFEEALVEAIAIGAGPDIIIVRQDVVFSNRNKSVLIPYESFPARDFRDSFIEESDMFLAPGGLIALPFTVDPLVMYWNRDIFSRAGIATPPRYWDEVFSITQRLTQKDTSGAILQSAVGLGEYANIKNAKEILSSMFLQAGNKVATWSDDFSSITVGFEKGSAKPEDVLSFYTQFADSRKQVNTWSRALPDSESMFLGNRLAMYLGFSSELYTLKEKSPNLNFDVALLPQSQNGAVTGTFGRLYSFMILRSAGDVPGTIQAAIALTSREATSSFVEFSNFSSVRRDSTPLAGNPYQAIFRQSALTSRAWVDPDRVVSDFAFREMVESVTSGFTTPGGALNKATQQIRSSITRP